MNITEEQNKSNEILENKEGNIVPTESFMDVGLCPNWGCSANVKKNCPCA
jgi:hypothetical protein